MSTPDFEVHRAIVHYSDPVSGDAQVRIPSLLGVDQVVSIPTIGLTNTDGFWNVPSIGASVFVAVSDDRTQFLWLTAVGISGSGGDDPSNEPIGHEDRTASYIAFDNGTRTFSIQPANGSYVVWCVGLRYEKANLESIQIPDTTGLYYISFNAQGQLQYSEEFFVWDQDCPTAYVYWNSTTQRAEFFADERHGITMDWQTHEYLHRTRGAAYANGFDASNFDTSTQDGNTDAQAKLDIDNGTFFDEDLQVDVRHSLAPAQNTWEQQLQGPARIPVFYKIGTGWKYDAPTDFPVKQGTTHPMYNRTSDWSVQELGANSYGIQWIVATNQLNYPILSIMGQTQYANVGQAEAASWADMDLDGLPIVEIRVLYKIIFRATGSNTPGCYFEQIDDYRNALSSATSTAAAVVDHGNLTGLADNDHPQYAVAGSDGQIQYNNGGSFGGASGLYYDDVNGSFGIGTTTPGARLEVAGSGLNATRIEGSVIGSVNDGYEINIVGGTPDSYTNAGGRIRLGGGARGDADIDSIIFMADTTEHMRISSSGNVGIGTAAPATLLHVSSGTSGDAELRISADTDNNNESDLPYLSFTADGGIIEGVVGLNDNTLVISNSVTSAAGIDLRTAGANTYTTAADQVASTTSRLFINSSGNVGINDSTPTYRLDVNGTGRFTETLYFGSSAGSRIYAGTNGANDTITLISDETYVSGQSIAIDTDSLDFRIGPVSTMKMSNRQVYWGYTGNQGLGTANTIVGTNFGVAYAFDNSSSTASVGTGWYTILNAYATPVVTGGKRWGTSNSFTCWVLWGFSAYSTNVSTKYTKVVANSSTTDYATSDQYFFYNTTNQHQGWSFFDTITFRQDLGTINFQLQVRSSSGAINFDSNDYKWIWVFKI